MNRGRRSFVPGNTDGREAARPCTIRIEEGLGVSQVGELDRMDSDADLRNKRIAAYAAYLLRDSPSRRLPLVRAADVGDGAGTKGRSGHKNLREGGMPPAVNAPRSMATFDRKDVLGHNRGERASLFGGERGTRSASSLIRQVRRRYPYNGR